MSAIGRISGPLLKSNLLRNGIDLAFETDLLYLDVNNQRIGIKNATPQYELDITGTTRTTNLTVTNRADIGNINIVGNTISSDNNTINLGTLNDVVYNTRLNVDDIRIDGNVISTTGSSANLELRPNASGTLEVLADMNVTGNIHATGNISADGNITLGDADTDNITFNADVASNIVPDIDSTYTLGTAGTVYSEGSTYTAGDITLVVNNGTGTLSIPAAGVAWIDDVAAETTGYYYLITLNTVVGTRYAATTTSNWSGTDPQTAQVSVPDIPNGTYSITQIQKDAKRWDDIWVKTITTDGLNVGNINVDGINLTLRQGSIYYVSENGDDTNYGDHPQDPFASLAYALSVAATDVSNGENAPTIHITPGVYTETFPLTVPTGVTVKGESLRSVKIVPTTETRYNDAFLLNGESTIEDVTVADFYSGGVFTNALSAGSGDTLVNVGTAPFAHTYVSGGTIEIAGTEYNISNATYIHQSGILQILHSGPSATIGQPVFIKGLVFSCNGGTRTFPDNGYAFRFATDFEVTSRSPYLKNITVITKGSVTSASDPRGFNAGDAGKGAYVDGAYATANSKEAAMLFHAATFITPGVDGLTATNGARIEWLNSFTYFANRGLHAFDSNDGLKGDGKTRIRLSGLSGTAPAAAQTVTFTSTDSSTVVGPLTIESVENSDTLIVDGRNTDLIGFDITPETIAFSGGGSASIIENVDVRDFGAEIRMIGSASVYGNQGLVGNGPGVLVYAIGHNLAYIGNGKEVTNDKSTVIQANEVIEINDAQIRYNSVDHKGDFRVGDLFYVNQETGSAAFSVSDFIINTANGVTFTTGSDTTFVDGSKIETGDWRFSGNTVETLTQDANIASASGTINLQDNTNITGDLDVTGNVTIGGNITIGDEATDTIQIVAGIDSDIIPRLDSTYSLGTATKTWSNLHTNQVNVDDIEIRDNFITTTTSSADLELRANGTGEIFVPSNNVQIDTNLTVGGLTTLANTNITGTLTHNGDTVHTGNYTIAGEISNSTIKIAGNLIETIDTNSDLELRANGTGKILIPNNDVQLDSSFVINGDTTLFDTVINGTFSLNESLTATGNINVGGNMTVAGDVSFGQTAQFEEILIDDNFITTTSTNANLELRANGTGEILVPNNDVNITNNLAVTGDIDANNLTVSQNITANDANIGDIQISGTTIEATASSADLELRANGTGIINVPLSDVNLGQALTVQGDTNLQALDITGNLTHVGDTTQTGNVTLTGNWTNGNIQVTNNIIQTTDSSSDLDLRANGTGNVKVETNDVILGQLLNVAGATDLQDTAITGVLTHYGNTVQTGDYTLVGPLTIAQDLRFSANTIETTSSSSNLELRANGSGIISIPTNNVTITNDLDVDGITNLDDTNIDGTLTHVGNTTQTGNYTITGQFSNGDIQINANTIETTDTNSDLELRASGTGTINVPTNNVTFSQALTVSGTTDLQDTNITGTVTHVGNVVQTGNLDIAGEISNGNILIEDNFIATTNTNSDLELRANGTGEILIPNNDVRITNNLFVNGDATLGDTTLTGNVSITGDITQTGDYSITSDLSVGGDLTVTRSAQFEEILIDDNFITTTTSSTDLELRANGTGKILIPNNDVTISNTLSVADTITATNITATGLISAESFNTGDILIDNNFITTTNSSSNLELRATGSVTIDDLEFLDSEIKSTSDITISPSTGSVKIDATGAIKLPVGNTLQRPTEVAGQIRFNSELGRFEGYDGTNWITLVGVEDLDGDTSVTAEATPGANDNTIRFNIAGSTVVDIDENRLNAPKVVVDDIQVDGNVISTTTANTDLVLTANGTGSVTFENFAFSDNIITNTVADSVTTFEGTDNGYVKFDGTYGLVIPAGGNVQRPPLANTETGMMRFNTDASRVEIYDGTNWVSVAGSSSGISRADAEDIAFEIVLSLG